MSVHAITDEPFVHGKPTDLEGKRILRVEVCKGCGARHVTIEGQKPRIILDASWAITGEARTAGVEEVTPWWCEACDDKRRFCD